VGRGRAPVGAAVRPVRQDPARRRPARLVGVVHPWPSWPPRPGHLACSSDGAVEYARSQGASAIEGYPVDNRGEKVDQTMAYVGARKLFEDAGFTKAADPRSVAGGFPRVLMRLSLLE
jgi:hypothetical protein